MGPTSEISDVPDTPTVDWASAPRVAEGEWMGRFGGATWRSCPLGIFLKGEGDERPAEPERTPGPPTTTRAVCDLFGPHLVETACRWDIPPEILVMVVATEAGMFREVGFTGPLTFRWEAHVKVRDVEPSFRGDYSFGPMQTLAGTARRVARSQELGLDPMTTFPALRERPNIAVEDLPGYEAKISLAVGGAVIADGLHRTGLDPILIAARYNAGGLYDASSPTSRFHNRWHLRVCGNHLDRAARWFGDACAVVGELRKQKPSRSERL